jgi:hypothetical protein
VGDSKKMLPTAGAALSYALNLAKTIEDGASLYVRDILGETVYRVDKVEGTHYVITVKKEKR